MLRIRGQQQPTATAGVTGRLFGRTVSRLALNSIGLGPIIGASTAKDSLQARG